MCCRKKPLANLSAPGVEATQAVEADREAAAATKKSKK
jgi:hypothetical protein